MMKINRLFLVAFLVLFFYSCGSNNSVTDKEQNAVATETSGTPAVKVRGQEIFEQKCMACHGGDGTAGIDNAANLHTSKLDSIAIRNIVSKGRNGMPAFGSQLTKEEIKDVAGYVMALRK